MLSISHRTWLEMVAEAWRVYPNEACGLFLAKGPGAPIDRFVAVDNVADSSRVFTLDPRGHMRIEREADDAGLEVVGVMHSHTHTAAYPSPTDVAEATRPLVPQSWHWAIVSLAWGFPELRSFRVSAEAGGRSVVDEQMVGEGLSSGMAEESILVKG